jgi:hypothetical protein
VRWPASAAFVLGETGFIPGKTRGRPKPVACARSTGKMRPMDNKAPVMGRYQKTP